jgi:hypothetical protein
MLACRLERALASALPPLLLNLEFLGYVCSESFAAGKSRQCHEIAGMAGHSRKYCERKNIIQTNSWRIGGYLGEL